MTAKKIISLLMAFILVASFGMACSNESETESGVESGTDADEFDLDLSYGENGTDRPKESLSEAETESSTDPEEDVTDRTPGETDRDTTAPGAPTVTPSEANPFPGRVSDLNGRELVFQLAGTIRPTTETEAGRRMAALIEDVEKKFNCTITFDSTSTQDQRYASIMAGNPKVDLMWAASHEEYINQYAGGLIQRMDSLLVADFNDYDRYSAATQLGRIGEGYYGISPLTSGYTGGSLWVYNVMYFNHDIVSDAGYSPSTIYNYVKNGQWTWDKFEEVAENVTSGGIYAMNDSELYFYNGLMVSNNTDWVQMRGNNLKFTGGESEGLQVLNYYRNLVNKGFIQVGDGVSRTQQNASEFNAGNTAFYVHPVWAIQHRINPATAFEWGVLPVPKAPGASDYVSHSEWVSFYVIPRGIRRPNEVLTILDYIQGNPIFTQAEDNAQYIAFYAPFVRDGESMDILMDLRKRELQSWSGGVSSIGLDWGSTNSWYPKVRTILNGQSAAGTVISEVQNQYDTLLRDMFVRD